MVAGVKSRITIRLILVWLLLMSMFAAPTFLFASPQTLPISTAGSVAGDLQITVDDSGEIHLAQKGASTFIDQLSSAPFANGSYLTSSLGICGLGFDSSTNALVVDNTLFGSDTIVTTVDCETSPGSGVVWATWEQVVHYISGDSAFIEWSITNTSGAALTNINFFHVQNTNIDGNSTNTFGFAQDSINKIGSRRVSVSLARVLSFESFVPHLARASGDRTTISSEVLSGSLTNVIDPSPIATNAFAQQWFIPELQSNETWALAGREQVLSSEVKNGLYLVPQSEVIIEPESSISVPFLLVNTNTSSTATVTLTSNAMPATFFSTMVSSPENLTGPSETEILVNLTSLPGAVDGDSTVVSLTSDDGSQTLTADSNAVVFTLMPPPTPTEIPTATPTETPTATPTETPTATQTPLPTEVEVSITYPFNTTASTTPVITGTAFPGSAVTLFIDGVKASSTSADSKGNWSIIPPTLTIGSHQLSAQSLDPFGRVKTLATAFDLYSTGGAELDFDGDGLTDFTTYVNLGTSVVFRWKTSSAFSSRVSSVKGTVPAAGDYDGDSTVDFAAIRRVGKTFVWSAILSTTNTKTEQTFGERGDTLITGCRFNSTVKSSLAVFRKKDLIYTDFNSTTLKQIDDILPSSLSYLGCADINSDGIDELIVSSGDATQTISAIKLDKQKVELGTTPKFTRSYVMRTPNDSKPLLLLVRSESPTKRSLQPFSLLGSETYQKLDVPRKLIVGSGLALDVSGIKPVKGLFYQDLKLDTVDSLYLDALDVVYKGVTVSKKSRTVVSQYLYPTR